jgi:hypothetical protein
VRQLGPAKRVSHAAPAVDYPFANQTLRSWHRHAVARDDLWLIRKNLAASRIHKNLHPMHIVVVAGRIGLERIVAKCFDAGKVLQPPPLRIQKRLVQVPIAVTTERIA